MWNIEQIKSEDLVIPIAVMGCPLTDSEMLYTGRMFDKLLEAVQRYFHRKISAICFYQAAGSVFFGPLITSFRSNIPIINGDFIGRTVTAINMISPNILNVRPNRVFFSNMKGHVLELESGDYGQIERYGRYIAMESGGFCLFSMFPMTGDIAKKVMIPGCFDRALKIGEHIAKRNLPGLLQYIKGKIVAKGVVDDVTIISREKYPRRVVTLLYKKNIYEIISENENLVVKKNGKSTVSIPDIITFLDYRSLRPLGINQVQKGQSVIVVSMKAPDIWYSNEGQKLVNTYQHFVREELACA